MSLELWCLFLAMVMALVHLTAASFSFRAQVGNRYSVGPRDGDLRPAGLAGRLDRAQRNFLETFRSRSWPPANTDQVFESLRLIRSATRPPG